MRGAIITGNIVDIIFIFFIICLFAGMLILFGIGLEDLTTLAGSILTSINDWFYSLWY